MISYISYICVTAKEGDLARAGIAASIVVLVIIIIVFTAVGIVYIR